MSAYFIPPISNNLRDKVTLPPRYNDRFRENTNEVLVHDRVMVSWHNGVFWGRFHERKCVLMVKEGRLYIYGSSTHDIGLSIVVPNAEKDSIKLCSTIKEGAEEKNVCNVKLKYNKDKLWLKIRGQNARKWKIHLTHVMNPNFVPQFETKVEPVSTETLKVEEEESKTESFLSLSADEKAAFGEGSTQFYSINASKEFFSLPILSSAALDFSSFFKEKFQLPDRIFNFV